MQYIWRKRRPVNQRTIIPVSEFNEVTLVRADQELAQRVKDFNIADSMFSVVFSDAAIVGVDTVQPLPESKPQAQQFKHQPESEPQTTPVEVAAKEHQDSITGTQEDTQLLEPQSYK